MAVDDGGGTGEAWLAAAVDHRGGTGEAWLVVEESRMWVSTCATWPRPPFPLSLPSSLPSHLPSARHHHQKGVGELLRHHQVGYVYGQSARQVGKTYKSEGTIKTRWEIICAVVALTFVSSIISSISSSISSSPSSDGGWGIVEAPPSGLRIWPVCKASRKNL